MNTHADIGESFRPVAHPYLVRGAYGVSWLYLAGDVANEGYKAYMRNQRVLHPETANDVAHGNIFEKVKSLKNAATDTSGVKAGGVAGEGSNLTGGEVAPGRVPAIEDWRAVAAQRAVFQSVASMGLPAFTIHSIVRYSGQYAKKNIKNAKLRTWGPIGVSATRNLSISHGTRLISVAGYRRRTLPPIHVRPPRRGCDRVGLPHRVQGDRWPTGCRRTTSHGTEGVARC